MSLPLNSALAAVALASTLTVAQAQITQERDPAHHHSSEADPAQSPAGPRGHQMMMMSGDRAGMMPAMQPRHMRDVSPPQDRTQDHRCTVAVERSSTRCARTPRR
jgi:hypothetical protein